MMVNMGDGPNSLLANGGTSLVIHEKADDMKTDPSGNSGGRIACGTITPKPQINAEHLRSGSKYLIRFCTRSSAGVPTIARRCRRRASRSSGVREAYFAGKDGGWSFRRPPAVPCIPTAPHPGSESSRSQRAGNGSPALARRCPTSRAASSFASNITASISALL